MSTKNIANFIKKIHEKPFLSGAKLRKVGDSFLVSLTVTSLHDEKCHGEPRSNRIGFILMLKRQKNLIFNAAGCVQGQRRTARLACRPSPLYPERI